MSTFIEYINSLEETLIAKFKATKHLSHPVNKGSAREAFIKEFLEQFLNETVSIGTGEIIDADSTLGLPRNQRDIVIYKNNYPVLPFGGGIKAFFAESVVATIEVKSELANKKPRNKKGKSEFVISLEAAQNAKKLKRNVGLFTSGHKPNKILTFIVAYDGPKNMETVVSWLKEYYNQQGLTDVNSLQWGGETIDGIFILNKGFVMINNFPSFHFGGERINFNNMKRETEWIYSNIKEGNLLIFFYLLTAITSYLESPQFDISYLKTFKLEVHPQRI